MLLSDWLSGDLITFKGTDGNGLTKLVEEERGHENKGNRFGMCCGCSLSGKCGGLKPTDIGGQWVCFAYQAK